MAPKTILQIVGFLLFVIGLLSLVLLLVGANLSILKFIDQGGRTLGLLLRLIMVFGGVVLVYLARTDWSKENDD